MKQLITIAACLVFGLTVALGATLYAAPSVKAATTPKAPKCGGGRISLTSKEMAMFKMHNRARTNRGIPRLCVHPALQRAARAHSKDMIRRDYYSHDTKGTGETFDKRLRRYGYNWRVAGENITLGSGAKAKPAPRFKAWMNSSPHRSNILNRKFREIGIGAYSGTFDSYAGQTTAYTADFGSR